LDDQPLDILITVAQLEKRKRARLKRNAEPSAPVNFDLSLSLESDALAYFLLTDPIFIWSTVGQSNCKRVLVRPKQSDAEQFRQ
jgi:hypothetical protein